MAIAATAVGHTDDGAAARGNRADVRVFVVLQAGKLEESSSHAAVGLFEVDNARESVTRNSTRKCTTEIR